MGALKIIGIIILAIIVIAIGVGIYFYNFHSFYTIRVCISQEIQDSTVSCSANEECVDIVKDRGEFKNMEEKIPEPMVNKIDEIINKAVYCEDTCKSKKVYGWPFDDSELESCKEDEEEVVHNIKGKEALQFAKYVGKIILEIE